jgi:hypothetical protein
MTVKRIPRSLCRPAFYRAELVGAPSWKAEGSTAGDAKRKLRELLDEHLNDPGHSVIVCVDGTVIVVEHGGYSQYRDGQHVGSCLYGDMTKREAALKALKHAGESYGGVVWSYPRV